MERIRTKANQSRKARRAPRQAGCPLCRKYPRPNAETQAALREADAIRADIESGRRAGVGADDFLAEMAAW